MGLSARHRTRAVVAVLAALAGAAAFDGWRWQRAAQWNARIAQGLPAATEAPPADAPAALHFLHAQALGEAGDVDGALQQYRRLYADAALGAAARYNSANLLVRQALQAQAGPQPQQALPLLELAKETYRDLLRLEPGHWDGRYNLERVQRLRPDALADEGEAGAPPNAAERAATTMRGVATGLP